MKPILAITMGDPAGIGPEVLVKAIVDRGDFDNEKLFVIGNINCLQLACRQTGLDLSFEAINHPRDLALVAKKDRQRVLVIEPQTFALEGFKQGCVSAAGGKAAVAYFEMAVHLALNDEIQGIVTCPINKTAIHAAGFVDDIGHQEILSRMTGSTLTATMLMTEGLKVAHLSTHLALGQAVAYVKTPILVEKLNLTAQHLKRWCGRTPKIAVAALNPHGGEQGMLGQEEIQEIKPAIEQCRADGLDIYGPYPADSVFYRAASGEFDAVLALYHDQGHIAIKMHNFEESITATMGIPFVRTSVDHGTAFDIAGQNRADATGLNRAIDAASDMLNQCLP